MSEQIIRDLEKRLNEADASKEIDTSYILDGLLHDKALIVGPRGELYDKEFVLKSHGPGRIPFDKVVVNELKIQMRGDVAAVYSLNTYTVNSESFKLRFFRVWSNKDGSWCVVGGSTTLVPEDVIDSSDIAN